jgi:pimeloyl-ACP methyl ester carboxylesterase
MPTIQTSGANPTELYYYEQGQGKPVVLVHGWPLSHRMWESQITALAEAGYRVIAYDRRGFGQSGRPTAGYDYDSFAADLNDLITQLDLRDVALAGFSMGGGEVARYIGRYGTGRVSKAMLLGAVPPFLLKTDDNPEGVDKSVFDGMLEGIRKERGAGTGLARLQQVAGLGRLAAGDPAMHPCLRYHRLPRRPGEVRRSDPGRARRRRPDRAAGSVRQALARDDPGQPARGGEGRAARLCCDPRRAAQRADAGFPEGVTNLGR